MLTMLRIANIILLLALVACLAGALAGLIIFAPFVGGAWLLNLVALTSYEEHARPGWTERIHAAVEGTATERASTAEPVPAVTVGERREKQAA